MPQKLERIHRQTARLLLFLQNKESRLKNERFKISISQISYKRLKPLLKFIHMSHSYCSSADYGMSRVLCYMLLAYPISWMSKRWTSAVLM
jgi:hypothetical protein